MLKTTYFSFVRIGLFVAISLTFAATVHAAPEDSLSGTSLKVYQLASQDDPDGLAEAIADLTTADLLSMVKDIAAVENDDETRNTVLRLIILAALQNAELDELCSLSSDLIEAVITATKGDSGAVSAAMQGIVEGTLNHSSFDEETEDAEKEEALKAACSCAAAKAIAVAEANDDIDTVKVAEAIAEGGVAGLGKDIDSGKLKAVVNGMSEGGVPAAREPNRPEVKRALQRAFAKVTPIDLRPVIAVPPPPVNPIEPEDVSSI